MIMSGLHVQTGLYCVVVTWWLLCINFGSGLCWGDRYMWPSQDGVGGVYGWWGFKSVSKILLGKIVELSFRWLFLVYSA